MVMVIPPPPHGYQVTRKGRGVLILGHEEKKGRGGFSLFPDPGAVRGSESVRAAEGLEVTSTNQVPSRD